MIKKVVLIIVILIIVSGIGSFSWYLNGMKPVITSKSSNEVIVLKSKKEWELQVLLIY
mgnify:CR=1 FL=1